MLEKKKYLLLFILIITVLLLTSGCLYYYPVVYTFGSIEITTNPPGAKIFLDGTDTGCITPYTLTNVLAGTHIIKLTLTDYINYSNVINVLANQTAEINLNLTPVIPAVFLIRISVLPSTMDLVVGESQNINSVTAYYSDSSTADISLANCTYEPYHTYDPSYTSVNSSGLITGISAGTALILVTYTEGTISKSDMVEVTVGDIVQNEIVYRALCVGVGDYINYGSDGDLLAPPYDVDNVRQILNQCRFGSSNTTFSDIDYLKDRQATKSNILQGIGSTFAGADSNDISYFYFSGHGSIIGNTS
ncbi:MAG: PEGA domain-containing protein, partial [Clostridiaceae bacterium]|nr:PEGA domain-containing protein [Clostridiaceae bacterium]